MQEELVAPGMKTTAICKVLFAAPVGLLLLQRRSRGRNRNIKMG